MAMFEGNILRLKALSLQQIYIQEVEEEKEQAKKQQYWNVLEEELEILVLQVVLLGKLQEFKQKLEKWLLNLNILIMELNLHYAKDTFTNGLQV